jgi:hypothetical protein
MVGGEKREDRMLDLYGILFSSLMMLFIIVRAVRLDRVQPWFQTVKIKVQDPAANKAGWQRRG